MAARTDFDPWTWEEAEKNRKKKQNASRVAQGRTQELRTAPSIAKTRRAASVMEECEELKVEIKRGREYLDLARKDLQEYQAFLEDWPTFEKHCGRNPLAHLAESVLVSERVVSFLTGWLKRREQRLMELSQRVAPFAQPKTAQRNHVRAQLS